MVGLSFGASHATTKIDNILWAYTSLVKKFIRAIIGGLITVGIYLLFCKFILIAY
jgi:hypothetical protein